MKDIQATIEIDLTKSKKELWNNLNKDARWGVNKAIKSKLRVESFEENVDGWDRFYEMYKGTIIRGGIAPANKQQLLQQADRLFLCFKDDKIIAGAVIKIKQDKNAIKLFLNASLKEYLKFQPNNLLYWELIKWGKENNYKIFDLGGYQLNTKKGDKLYEVNRFKERWGGEIKKYYIHSKNPLYILGRKVIRNSRVAKRIKDKIKLAGYNVKHSNPIDEET